MRARPAWVRRLFATLALGAVVAAVAMGFGYLQVTADGDAGNFKKLDPLDGREAERKIGIYKKALDSSQRGFIRLSEMEINSYLNRQYFGDTPSGETNAPALATKLFDSRVKIAGQEMIWYCWVRQKWLGCPFDLVWRRVIGLSRRTNQWHFEIKAMSLGNVAVPPRFWNWVNRELGEADLRFSKERRWAAGLPTIEIRTNALKASPELRLYTYPVTGPIEAQKP